jgi:hypothetical protein
MSCIETGSDGGDVLLPRVRWAAFAHSARLTSSPRCEERYPRFQHRNRSAGRCLDPGHNSRRSKIFHFRRADCSSRSARGCLRQFQWDVRRLDASFFPSDYLACAPWMERSLAGRLRVGSSLEVFEHFALGIGDHGIVLLTGPVLSTKPALCLTIYPGGFSHKRSRNQSLDGENVFCPRGTS